MASTMRTLVDSLKRLYNKGSVTSDRLRGMVAKGTIDEEDFEYITGTSFVVEEKATTRKTLKAASSK